MNNKNTLNKKPIEQIQPESAKDTIVNQHKKFGKIIGVNGCFGSSNLGQKTGFIAREIVKAIPNAFMRCPLAIHPQVDGPIQVMLYDDYQVTIDGCKAKCLKKTLEKAGIKVDLAYALDEHFSCEKNPGPDFDEKKMEEIAAKIIKDIKEKILTKTN